MTTPSKELSIYSNQSQLASYFIDEVGLISVKSYGAKGDGVTDDTQAILDCLSDVSENSLKSIFFPHGNYLVNPALISASNFTGIFCWGDNSTLVGITHPINQMGLDLSPVTTFTGLTDTPATMSGQTGKVVAVNSEEDALEFVESYNKTQIDNIIANYYTETEVNAIKSDLEGVGRTTETIKGNADNLTTHQGSSDHDSRYYTKTNVQTSGQASVHWNNLTNVPALADSKWKAPVADVSSLPDTGNSDGDLRIVLDVDTVYTWDVDHWEIIGASGNGISDHGTLIGLGDDDHTQYLRADGTRALTGNMDFGKHQGVNFVTENKSTAPVSAVVGQLWYDTVNNVLKVYKGTIPGWTDVTGNGAIIRDLEVTTANGQTVFDLSSVGIYEVGTNVLTVYKKNGSIYEVVPEADYVETSSSTVTISGALENDVYYFKWFENSPIVINLAVQKDGTLQTNLNADLLDGLHSSAFATLNGSNLVSQNPASTGQANGIATLDAGGQVPASQLGNITAPDVTKSYVDDGDFKNSLDLAKGLFTMEANIAAGKNDLAQMAIDAFNDSNGVDLPTSTNETYSSGNKNFAPSGYVRTSSQKTVTANGNARTKTFGQGNVVTAGGNAQIDTAQYKIGSSSGLFDGTGDYLSIPDSADWDFGTGEFTIDFWVRFNALPSSGNSACLFSQLVDLNNYANLYVLNATGTYSLKFLIKSSSSTLVDMSNVVTLSTNTWYHIEIDRSGNNFKMYLDGVQQGADVTASITYPNLAAPVIIGALNYTGYIDALNGWIDEFRISKGIARNSSTPFTPPSSAYTTDSYTKLLLHFEGSDASTSFIDSSSTLVPKYGTAMGYFDGTGDYLSVPDSTDWYFDGNFTIQFWVNFNSLPGSGSGIWLIGQQTDVNNRWSFHLGNNSGTYALSFVQYVSGSININCSINLSSLNTDTWYHMAVTRSGNDYKIFVDGVQQGTTYTDADTLINLTGSLIIGIFGDLSSYALKGYIDDLEIAKGIARTITTPTAALVPDQYTVLMLHMDGSEGGTTFTDDVGLYHSMTLISNAFTASAAPSKMYVTAKDTPNGGSVTYYVSRDGGSTWTAATKDTLVDVSAQPSGTSCKVKAVTAAHTAITTVDAWAFGYKV